MNRQELIAIFMEKAALAAAGVVQVTDADALTGAVSLLVHEGCTVYCPAISELERAAVRDLASRVGNYGEADVTVEEVLAGIAETGSIICASVDGRAVQASLLPSHHVALLPAGKIYGTLEDFFASLKVPPTNIAIITGPSRTADIELTLAIGVHGPERLDVVVASS